MVVPWLCEVSVERPVRNWEPLLLSRDEFVENFIRGLQRAGETRPVHYDAHIFCLVIGEKREAPDIVIGMSEVFRNSQTIPPDRLVSEIDDLAKQYYRPPLPEDYATAEPHLGLSLKHFTFLQLRDDFTAAWASSAPRSALAHANITEEIVCCIGLVAGPAVQYVTEARLAQWGVTTEHAFSAAIANLGKSTFTLEASGSVYVTPQGDLEAAARFIFLHPALNVLRLDGSPVVLVPSRDRLVVTGSNNLDGLVQMAAIGQLALEESGGPVSAQPLVWENGRWKPYEPPEQVKPAFVHLEQAFEVDRYRAQSGVLALKYRNAEDRPGVAEVRLFPSAYGYESYTIWRSDRPTLLPKADKIALHDKVRGTFEIADWADMSRVLGDRLVPLQHNPVRFLVDRFPTPNELQAMNATRPDMSRPQQRPSSPRTQQRLMTR